MKTSQDYWKKELVKINRRLGVYYYQKDWESRSDVVFDNLINKIYVLEKIKDFIESNIEGDC